MVIPCSSSYEHIKSNIQVFDDWELSKEDLEMINGIEKQERMVDPSWGEFDK